MNIERPSAEPVTLEDVRKALQEYAARLDAKMPGKGKGMEMARKLLGDHGNGANRLALAMTVPGGDQGVIEPKYYQAVIDAAKTAAV